MTDVRISQAEMTAEVETALSLWQEAALWLESIGQPLWKPEHFTLEYGQEKVDRGELYLAWSNEQAVGACLLQEEDAFFWPDIPTGESLFVHRLAVSRSVAGKGVAQQMLDWAAEEAIRRGKRYVRLDCDGERSRLCDFYRSAGFHIRDSQTKGRYTIARFEKILV